MKQFSSYFHFPTSHTTVMPTLEQRWLFQQDFYSNHSVRITMVIVFLRLWGWNKICILCQPKSSFSLLLVFFHFLGVCRIFLLWASIIAFSFKPGLTFKYIIVVWMFSCPISFESCTMFIPSSRRWRAIACRKWCMCRSSGTSLHLSWALAAYALSLFLTASWLSFLYGPFTLEQNNNRWVSAPRG